MMAYKMPPDYVCGDCGFVMAPSVLRAIASKSNETVRCLNRNCGEFNVPYVLPMERVELVRSETEQGQ